MRFQLFLYTIFVLSYSSFGQVRDIDGNTYKTVQIGDQIWMAENLKVTHFNDGTAIKLVKDSSSWDRLNFPAYCFYENNSSSPYGALYNFYAVETEKLCPVGWHVPSNYEWNTLIKTIGGEQKAGEMLKATYSWENNASWCHSMNGKNSVGFNILRSGVRGTAGRFSNSGAYFWSSDQSNHYFFCSETMSSGDFIKESAGYSIRCAQDQDQEQNSSGLLDELEDLFELNPGELFRHVQEKLQLSDQKFVTATKVRFKHEEDFIYDFVYEDSSLKKLKDITIMSVKNSLYASVNSELESNPDFKKLQLDEETIHYSSDKFQYILSKAKTEQGGWLYIIMIYYF